MMYNMNMLKNKFISFTIFAIITYSASFIGSLATFSYKEPWYSTLNKSSLTAPDWVFAPVWTSLYLMMAIAIWSAWHKSYNINLVLIYLIHLCFNTTWSIVFFVLHNIELALLNLIIILTFIIILIFKYKKISSLSFYIMIPYLLWSSYALVLNLILVYLN